MSESEDGSNSLMHQRLSKFAMVMYIGLPMSYLFASLQEDNISWIHLVRQILVGFWLLDCVALFFDRYDYLKSYKLEISVAFSIVLFLLVGALNHYVETTFILMAALVIATACPALCKDMPDSTSSGGGRGTEGSPV